MSATDSTRASGHVAGEPFSPLAVAAIVVAAFAVLVAAAVVITTVSDSGDGAAGVPIEAPAGAGGPGGAGGAGGESAATLPDPVETDEEVVPTGRVAYVTADGRVLTAMGAEEPVEVAQDAAIGEADLGSVQIAPTGDLVAYVREDGALVALAVSGGEPLVLATDVALDAVGKGPVISWDPTGAQLSYLAVGTEDMARPRPTTPPPLSSDNVFRVPLPEGVLGNVVKVVDRTGAPIATIGDPSTRSMVGIATSQSDDLMILESVAPDTGAPYTLALASAGAPEEIPTVLSADDPSFSPDGNFVIAVGPDKSGQELLRVETDQLSRTTLVSTDRVCNPAVSPDSSRIVYGTGEDCSRLHLISSRGGQPVDITPPARPGDASFAAGALGWTAEGRFVTFADCRSTSGPVRCGGNVTFLDPDQRLVLEGPEASTVAPIRQPLLQDLQLDLVMEGPLRYERSFPIDASAQGDLTEVDEATGRVDMSLTDGDRAVRLELQVQDGADFATGRLSLSDPEQGIERSFLILGTPSVLGVRVASLSGMWISTDDLPFASGEFRLAIRRR
jgi:hypothetical protein